MSDQATAFDPFKGFGPKIKIRKTGDHGQRNDQRARPMHEVSGDQHRPDPEEWLGRARAAGAAVRQVLDPPQGDEPEVEASGEPPTGRPAPGVDIVEVDDPRWFQRAGEHPWPAKFTRFRPDQLTATEQIIEAFDQGARVVMLDAPTGSGKTLAAEMVRRRLGVKGVYVCSGKQLQDQFCVMPLAKILTADLRWVDAETITVGQELFGFDEERTPHRRNWRKSVVTEVAIIRRPCKQVRLEDGTSFYCSNEHRWLVGRGEWRRTDELNVKGRNSTKLIRLLDTWQEGTDLDAGYLAAAFDGEGHLHQSLSRKRTVDGWLQNGADVNLSFAQKDNEMLEEVKAALTRKGFGWTISRDKTGCNRLQLRSRAEVMRFLGEMRPRRLLPKLLPDMMGMLNPARPVAVVKIKDVGMQEVVAIKTTTGTYVADGFASHNCNDFGEYARVLKGRSNYPTATMPYPEYTGDDCTGRGCRFCPTRAECPYQHAKVQAMTATVGVLNTSYLLAEANTAGTFGEKEVKGRMTRRPFIVVDEADTLEGALMGYVEFKVSARLLEDLGLQPPVKAARTKTVQAWIGSLVSALEVRVEAMQDWDESDVALMRRKRGVQRVLDQARGIELGNDEDPDGWGDWIRVYETKWDPKAREERDVASFVLKPVVVNDWGMERLWRHSDKWLIMSATIISPDEMAESLGLDQAGVPWAVVRMPMPFAKENRPIVMKPVANITYAEAAVEKPKMLAGIAEILDRYEGENILVHTVSYSLTKYLADGLLKERQKGRWNRGRQILAYSNAKERDAAVEAFNRTGGVLLAPSLDRGLDLPDDLCRVVVVAKVPFPALGDRQVSERLRRPGGQVWYGVQVARSLVQMTGRGVRHENDWATTFILDKQFPRWYREAGRKLLPDWWIEAITSDRKQAT